MNAETHPFTSAYPELGTGPVPVEPYISKDYFERECAQIFARTWINVGCEEQIPNPGDYFVRELAVCNTSVIVMRGKDKRVRSFHNMCSHRGNPVAWETQGTCKGLLVCNFHGWSYDTEGKLAYVTDEERFFNVDRAKNGLTAIATDTWEGFIFINLAPEPRESLAEFLGPAAAAMDGYPFSQYSYTYVYEVDDGVNWKVLTEAQLEGWHVPVLHKKTLAKSVVNKGELFRHAALQRYGRHALVSSHAPEVYHANASYRGQYEIRCWNIRRLFRGIREQRQSRHEMARRIRPLPRLPEHVSGPAARYLFHLQHLAVSS